MNYEISISFLSLTKKTTWTLLKNISLKFVCTNSHKPRSWLKTSLPSWQTLRSKKKAESIIRWSIMPPSENWPTFFFVPFVAKVCTLSLLSGPKVFTVQHRRWWWNRRRRSRRRDDSMPTEQSYTWQKLTWQQQQSKPWRTAWDHRSLAAPVRAILGIDVFVKVIVRRRRGLWLGRRRRRRRYRLQLECVLLNKLRMD